MVTEIYTQLLDIIVIIQLFQKFAGVSLFFLCLSVSFAF